MKYSASIAALLALVPLAVAQSQVWGQCGGIGWTGPTTCVAGSSCVFSNDYYSQCLPGAAPSQPPPPPSGPTTTSPSGGTPTNPPSGSGLNALFKAAGKLYFGTATDTNEFNDAAYMAILNNANEFGQLTPANSMKWDATEPSRGSFQFSNADRVVAQARQNGQIMRGHNCVWYSQLPSWVSGGSWTASTLTSVMQTHCTTVMNHFKGQIYSWDVVNEPFNDDGTWRTDVFYNVLGTNYITLALQAARAADPNAKLYINDYNIEYSGPKLTAMLNLVRSLKQAGAPLDGIGLQGHFISGNVPGNIASVLSQFTALGVEVAITELDIRMTTPSNAQKLQQQKQDYQNVVSACASVQGCIGITIWDFSDKYSWVPQTFGGQGAACPWDDNMAKKPAYDGIVAGI